MKKIFVSLVLALSFASAFSQKTKISEMPEASGNGAGGYIPIVLDGQNNKILADSLLRDILAGKLLYIDTLDGKQRLNVDSTRLMYLINTYGGGGGVDNEAYISITTIDDSTFTLNRRDGTKDTLQFSGGSSAVGGSGISKLGNPAYGLTRTNDSTYVVDSSTIATRARLINELGLKQNQLQSGTGFVKISGTTISYDNSTYLTSNQAVTITATGDATGVSSASGTAPSIPLTLVNVNSNVGSFTNANITVNAKGLITAASNGAGGGGGGSLTDFSSGNLSPLFTTSVANSTTTPALTYTLTNASGYMLFGNRTASSAAPIFFLNPFLDSMRRNTGNLTVEGRINGQWVAQFTDSTGGANTWRTSGNSGLADTSKLGTLDNKAVQIVVNNIRRMLFNPDSTIKFGAATYNERNNQFSISAIVPTSGLGQGMFFVDSTSGSKYGAIQSISAPGSIMYFGVNKYYTGSAWSDMGLSRAGSVIQLNNDKLSFIQFNTGTTQVVPLQILSDGKIGLGFFNSGSTAPVSDVDIRGPTATTLRIGHPAGDQYTYTAGRGVTGSGYLTLHGYQGGINTGYNLLDGPVVIAGSTESDVSDLSSRFEVQSTTKGSIPAPKMTTSQRNAIVGIIVSGNISNAGSGYTNATYTAVALTGGTGTGATATIVVAGGVVTSVTIVSGGSGYLSGDVLSSSSISAGTGFLWTVVAINGKAGLQVYLTDQNISSVFNGKSWQGGLTTTSAGTLSLLHGQDYVFTGTTSTWTLPAVVATITGRANIIVIKNRGSGSITLNSDTGSTIYTTSAQATITIAAGAAAELMPDGTFFNVLFNQ